MTRERFELSENPEIKTVPIGEWRVNCVEKALSFPPECINEGLRILHQWAPLFPKEQTWVQKESNIPSLIVRLDATIVAGNLEVYEVEERPAGIGVTQAMNNDFRERFQRLLKKWPSFQVLISEDRRGTDDYLWAPIADLGKIDSSLLLIRAEPNDQRFHAFEEQSVSSLMKEGDKSYGESLGLWSRVNDPEALDWERPFVIKPLQGTRGRDIYIWHPDKLPGSYNKGRIIRVLQEHPSGMYVQLFLPPIGTGWTDFPWMILRVFFGYDIGTRQWECLGGVWMARKNLKIHGATDSISGPLVL